jgi:hypothetical protein
MKKLLVAVLLLAIAASAPLWEAAAPRSVRIGIWSALLIICIAILANGVVQKRKAGKSWNEALSAGSTLMTGSVWKDGAIFAGIMIAVCASVFALFFWL